MSKELATRTKAMVQIRNSLTWNRTFFSPTISSQPSDGIHNSGFTILILYLDHQIMEQIRLRDHDVTHRTGPYIILTQGREYIILTQGREYIILTQGREYIILTQGREYIILDYTFCQFDRETLIGIFFLEVFMIVFFYFYFYFYILCFMFYRTRK
jgi:hypothetical protein